MIRITILAAALGLLLNGCSALSPYSTQTRLHLTLNASDQLNPDVNGRASPLVLRLLELKHPVAFENTDFFSLYERGNDILVQDLVTSEELEVRPGQALDLKLTVEPSSRYVGVLAAYRDLPETQWRYVIAIRAQELTRIDLYLGQDGIHDAADSLAKAGD